MCLFILDKQIAGNHPLLLLLRNAGPRRSSCRRTIHSSRPTGMRRLPPRPTRRPLPKPRPGAQRLLTQQARQRRDLQPPQHRPQRQRASRRAAGKADSRRCWPRSRCSPVVLVPSCFCLLSNSRVLAPADSPLAASSVPAVDLSID